MEFIKDFSKLHIASSVVTIGKFDGNHRGHQALFETAAGWKAGGLKAVVFALSIRYPELFLESRPTKLMTDFEREYYNYIPGIDCVIDCDFTPELMNMQPEEFVKTILVDRLGTKRIVVGSDFRFGKGRAGDAGTLFELGRKYGFQTIAIQKVKYRGQDISSSRIKGEILDGNLKEAADMLGRPYSITAEVVKGKQLGQAIGFPTINFIAPPEKILPPDGVYAAEITVNNRKYYGMTNIGKNPTVNAKPGIRTIETHIFKFRSDVYGKTARVEFREFIRPEIKFDSVAELQKQIAIDTETAKGLFEMDGYEKPKKKAVANRDPRFLTLDV